MIEPLSQIHRSGITNVFALSLAKDSENQDCSFFKPHGTRNQKGFQHSFGSTTNEALVLDGGCTLVREGSSYYFDQKHSTGLLSTKRRRVRDGRHGFFWILYRVEDDYRIQTSKLKRSSSNLVRQRNTPNLLYVSIFTFLPPLLEQFCRFYLQFLY